MIQAAAKAARAIPTGADVSAMGIALEVHLP